MDILKRLSDFEELSALKFTTSVSPTGLDILRDGSLSSRLENPFHDRTTNPDNYVSFLCFTGHKGEAQVSKVKLRGADESSLGYIFPLEALRSGELIEDRWGRTYAWVAVNALLSDAQFECAVTASSSEMLRQESISLEDLFPSHLSVAVLGLQNLSKHGVPPDAVRLMLMGQGLQFPSSPALFANRGPLRDWSGSISCSPLSSEALSDVEMLTVLVRLGDEFDSPVGVFLTRYQIVEHWLSKLFGAALAGSYADSPDPWTLKNRLSKVAGEKWRLAKLDGLALDAVNRGPLNDLGRCCQHFLTSVGVDVKPDDAWWKSLYRLRNLIVHDQARFVVGGFDDLLPVNLTLRQVCLELLTCFAVPEPAAFWTGEEEEAEGEGRENA